jgi:hypothetical protein
VSTFPAKSTGWKPTALLRSVLFAPLAFVFVSRKAALLLLRTRAPQVLFASRIFSILLALFLLKSGFLCSAQVRSAESETDHTAKATVKAAYEAYLGHGRTRITLLSTNCSAMTIKPSTFNESLAQKLTKSRRPRKIKCTRA